MKITLLLLIAVLSVCLYMAHADEAQKRYARVYQKIKKDDDDLQAKELKFKKIFQKIKMAQDDDQRKPTGRGFKKQIQKAKDAKKASTPKGIFKKIKAKLGKKDDDELFFKLADRKPEPKQDGSTIKKAAKFIKEGNSVSRKVKTGKKIFDKYMQFRKNYKAVKAEREAREAAAKKKKQQDDDLLLGFKFASNKPVQEGQQPSKLNKFLGMVKEAREQKPQYVGQFQDFMKKFKEQPKENRFSFVKDQIQQSPIYGKYVDKFNQAMEKPKYKKWVDLLKQARTGENDEYYYNETAQKISDSLDKPKYKKFWQLLEKLSENDEGYQSKLMRDFRFQDKKDFINTVHRYYDDDEGVNFGVGDSFRGGRGSWNVGGYHNGGRDYGVRAGLTYRWDDDEGFNFGVGDSFKGGRGSWNVGGYHNGGRDYGVRAGLTYRWDDDERPVFGGRFPGSTGPYNPIGINRPVYY